jgi:hypothetical protein
MSIAKAPIRFRRAEGRQPLAQGMAEPTPH